MKKPDFIIAGEARCGTTSFYEDLIKHPQILPANPHCRIQYGGELFLSQKEPRFFDKNWHKGMDWYYSCFSDQPNTITGEASATYFFKALSMTRIRKLLPGVKLIILLRNPIDRLYSHFFHIKRFAPKWHERYSSFERFLESAHENDYYIIDKGLYIRSLQICLQLFDRRQIHIIRSEDYYENPRQVYIKIQETLALDPFLPERFSSLRGSNPPSKMPAHIREMLAKFYRPYNLELYELIERDMMWD